MHVILMGKFEEPLHGRKANSQTQWLNYAAFEVYEFEVPEELIKITKKDPEELIKITNKGSLCSEETVNIVINTNFYNE